MAISTYKTYLMSGSESGSLSKLIDIVEFPDLGQAPDTIDVTTLSDGQHMYINDIIDTGALEFTANFDVKDYAKLNTCTNKYFGVYFGDSTSPTCKFTFEGELACWPKGGGVGDAVQIGISIAPSTKITFTDCSASA